jgi:hypothetical protein
MKNKKREGATGERRAPPTEEVLREEGEDSSVNNE